MTVEPLFPKDCSCNFAPETQLKYFLILLSVSDGEGKPKANAVAWFHTMMYHIVKMNQIWSSKYKIWSTKYKLRSNTCKNVILRETNVKLHGPHQSWKSNDLNPHHSASIRNHIQVCICAWRCYKKHATIFTLGWAFPNQFHITGCQQFFFANHDGPNR